MMRGYTAAKLLLFLVKKGESNYMYHVPHLLFCLFIILLLLKRMDELNEVLFSFLKSPTHPQNFVFP